jgi:flagellin-like hook-associated protein FlgL
MAENGPPRKMVNPPADIIFALDISGSMGTSVAYLQNTVKDFMAKIPGDLRVGFILYADYLYDNSQTTKVFPLNSNPDAVQAFIDSVSAKPTSSGMYESGLEAVHEAMDILKVSGGRERHIVMITDEPSHVVGTIAGATHTNEETNKRLKDEGVIFHAFFPRTLSVSTKEQYDAIAAGTGGATHDKLDDLEDWPTSAPIEADEDGMYSDIILQIGANGTGDQQLAVHRYDMRASRLGVSNLDISTRESANAAIAVLDGAINRVSEVRAYYGATQNRLEHTSNNLGVSKENLQAAESSIRDIDMAKEMMEFTKNNILSQASQSMLAQVNQLPSGVLQLLQ